MDTIEAIRTRRSIRKFSDERVSDEILMEILEDGRAAPSAGNLQARDFIIVRDEGKKNEIAKAAYNQHFVAEADVVIVVCANRQKSAPYGERGMELYCIQDADAAVMTMLLSIHARDLASLWVGAFDEGRVSRILNIPDHARPVAILPMGYPSKDVGKAVGTRRLHLEVMLHHEDW